MKKRIIAAMVMGVAMITSACSSQDLDMVKKEAESESESLMSLKIPTQ